MNKLIQSLVVGICVSLPCTLLTLALLHKGPPAVVRTLETLTIVPFFLTWFTAMLLRWDQGAGVLVYGLFIFMQWSLIGFALFYPSRLALSLAYRIFRRINATPQESPHDRVHK